MTWENIAHRTLADVLAAARLVETIETGKDAETLRAFVVDELADHDEIEFAYTRDKLLDAIDFGVGNPSEPVRNEAAFARTILQSLASGCEVLPRGYRERRA